MTTTATRNSGSSSIPSHIVVPEEFICPITMEIMVYPLVSKRGATFERHAIIAWLRQGNNHCPLTRTPLCAHDMIHNNYLAAEIAKWRAANGILAPSSVVVSHDQTTPNANGNVAPNSEMDHGEEMDTAEEQRLAHIYGTAALPYQEVVPAFSKKSKSESSSRCRRRTAGSAATATTATTASTQQRTSASSSIGSSVKSLLASVAPKCFFSSSPKKPSKVSRAVAA